MEGIPSSSRATAHPDNMATTSSPTMALHLQEAAMGVAVDMVSLSSVPACSSSEELCPRHVEHIYAMQAFCWHTP